MEQNNSWPRTTLYRTPQIRPAGEEAEWFMWTDWVQGCFQDANQLRTGPERPNQRQWRIMTPWKVTGVKQIDGSHLFSTARKLYLILIQAEKTYMDNTHFIGRQDYRIHTTELQNSKSNILIPALNRTFTISRIVGQVWVNFHPEFSCWSQTIWIS